MGSRDRRANSQAGFTILETTISLAVVFVVLVGLLGALTAGVRGLVTGRQRSAALAVANEVMEGARARDYGDVGHDFDSDPTLSTDPLITGTAPNLMYGGEPLATSAVDAGASGGTVNNPLFPFSPHRFTTKREATTYTTTVYITTVAPATGDPYKRITTIVTWSPAQYATAAKSVTLSSFLYNAAAPPDPKLVGTGEADGGSLRVSGSLTGLSLSDASITLPYVSGGIDSGFVRSAKGLARSGSSEVNLLAGLISGCSLSVLGLGAYCDPALAEADADNDSGTAPPDTDQDGPNAAAGGTITAPPLSPLLTVGIGSGSAQAQATARSCWSCYPTEPNVGDDDRLPFFYGRATGPDTVTSDFVADTVLGDLLEFGASPTATVTVDRDDDLSGNPRVTSRAEATFPAMALLTLAAGPAGYSGAVKIDALPAFVNAEAGPGVPDPTASTNVVNVQYWGGGGYVPVSITLGVASSTTIPSVSFASGLATVTVSGSITSTSVVTSKTIAGGAVTAASAGLTNWLFVDLQVRITTLLGVELADLNLHLDYGRLAATAVYEPIA